MSEKYCFDSKSEALAVGKEKLKLLKNPKGWKIQVWENLGWHMSLHKGNLYLHYSFGTFSGFLSDEHPNSDCGFWHESFHHKDPNKVVARKLEVAQAFVDNCQAIINEVKK